MNDLISRQAAIDYFFRPYSNEESYSNIDIKKILKSLPTITLKKEDYTELKREFILMALYIDALLVCSNGQKETLLGFISRMNEFMPWTRRD